jgi:aconitase B
LASDSEIMFAIKKNQKYRIFRIVAIKNFLSTGKPMKSKKSKINPEVWVYGTAIWGTVIPFHEIEIIMLGEIFFNVYPPLIPNKVKQITKILASSCSRFFFNCV